MPISAADSAAPFVGREAELHQLQQTLQAVIRTRQPKFMLIEGDFGVGKTALVAKFLNQVSAQNPSVLIGQGKCAMETELNGLIPFVQLFSDLAYRGTQRRIVLGSVLEFVKEVAPAWADMFTGGVLGAVGKTVEETGKLLGRSAFSQESLSIQFTNALSRLAEKQPVIVFLDDLHWADASSFRLLFHLARYFEDRAMLFLCAYRPVQALELGSNTALFRDIRANLIRHGAIEVEISQGIDVATYVTQRYVLNTFPDTFIRQVQQLTGGHALFVSQLFSMWQETSVITSVPAPDGQPVWELAHNMRVATVIPQALGEVLEERIRLMEDDLRETLTYASVEGEDFTAQVIAHLRQLDDLKVCDNLEILEHRYRLVQEQTVKEFDSIVLDLYRFGHRFFREHIYHQMGAGKRRILHRQVGECLEELYTDRHQIAGQLALHFREAHQPLKAAQYALAAAEFEQARYVWEAAEHWCEFGLELVDKLTQNAEKLRLRLNLFEGSGKGFYYAGNYIKADQRYRTALELAQQIQVEPEQLASIYYWLAQIADAKGPADEALMFIEQGKQVLLEHAVPFSETHVLLEGSWGYEQGMMGSSDIGIKALQNALDFAEKLPQTRSLKVAEADMYVYMGVLLLYLSRYSESLKYHEKAIETAQKANYEVLIPNCLVNIAECLISLGDLDPAMDYLSKGIELAHQRGDIDMVSYGHYERGQILLLLERPEEAHSELMNAIALAEQAGSQMNGPYMYSVLATTELALSRLETAQRSALRGLEYAQKSSRRFDEAYALAVLAGVEAAQQNYDLAKQHFTEAIAIYQETGDRHGEAETQRDFATMLLEHGDKSHAAELLQAALTIFQELALPNEIADTQRQLQKSAKDESNV